MVCRILRMLLQAKVDFNADSAQYIKQQELLHSSRIQLNELMANNNVNQNIIIKDSTIDVHSDLQFDDLPTSGEILYHGQSVTGPKVNAPEYRSHVGMVFQSFNLFNNMTVLENCVVQVAST